VVLTVGVLLAACGTTTAARRPTAPSTTAPTTATTPTTLPPQPPVAPVAWTPCGGTLQCATVAVPLDYRHPTAATLQIAVARQPALDPAQRIGSLVINPGGPGDSGIDDLADELKVLTPGLLDRFDIVSFDPRGVQRSSPVTCTVPSPGTTATTSGQTELPDPAPTTVAGVDALVATSRAYATACEQVSGSILPYVGTIDTARDLDRIRQALGDAQLTFLGHSYGTLLGATYAELYPTHVRAMVLDGAIDPAEDTDQMAVDQAESFEAELDAFFAWCASTTSCPWRPTGDPTAAVLSLIDRSRATPLPVAGGQGAGPGELYFALVAGLGSTSDWPKLGDALAAASAGDGSAVAAMTDTYAAGGSSNAGDAERAIDCLDHPVLPDPSAFPTLAARAGSEAPVFGPLLVWTWVGCAVWPVPADRVPAPTTAPGSPPILVTGTLHDPVTPYHWAVALAGELSEGVLVTWDGQSHVAYYYSPCIRAIDQDYLIDGTVPPPGTTCTD
jgi:pimeloyl-ACP methyl ester carboxylesterase